MYGMVDRIVLALEGLEQGDYATESKGFGRGVSLACRVIRAAIANTHAVKHPLGGCNNGNKHCQHY